MCIVLCVCVHEGALTHHAYASHAVEGDVELRQGAREGAEVKSLLLLVPVGIGLVSQH